MRLCFTVDGASATMTRDWLTGKASLIVDGESVELANPLDPTTHFSAKLTKTWSVESRGHNIVIEKIRPLIFAGFRPQAYRVFMDGQLLLERTGY